MLQASLLCPLPHSFNVAVSVLSAVEREGLKSSPRGARKFSHCGRQEVCRSQPHNTHKLQRLAGGVGRNWEALWSIGIWGLGGKLGHMGKKWH